MPTRAPGLSEPAQIAQQNNRLGNFMIGLQKEHGVDAVGRQIRIVWLAQDRLDVL